MRFKIGVLGALALGLIVGGAADSVNAAQAMAQAPALPGAHAIAVKAFVADAQPANLSAASGSQITKKPEQRKAQLKNQPAKRH